MSKTSKLQAILAAVVIVVGGSLFALAGEEERTVEVKVMKQGGEKVTVNVGGEEEVITLGDLADGETRTIESSEHGTITIEREGDQLHVDLEGFEHGDHKKVCKRVVIRGDDEEDHEMIFAGEEGEIEIKKVIKCAAGDHDGDMRKIIIRKGEGDEGTWNFVGGDGDPIVIDLDIEEGYAFHSGALGKMHKHFESRVHLTCPEDGTHLNMKEEDATQERYLCPVCGTEMEKSESMIHKIVSVGAKCDEEKEED